MIQFFFETFLRKIMEKIKYFYFYFNTQKLKKFLNVDVIIYEACKSCKCKNKWKSFRISDRETSGIS